MKPTITKIVCPQCASERTKLTRWVKYTDVETGINEYGREYRCAGCGHIWQTMDLVYKFSDQNEANDERKTVQASNQ